MLRGLQAKDELDPSLLLRDTRTMGQRVSDFLKNRTNTAVVLVSAAFATFLIPAIADLVLLIGCGCFVFSVTRKTTLPFRLPKRSNLLDHNDLKPGTHKPQKARGICFLGNDKNSNEELWFTNEDMRTHVLIFGSTGSGKTEALVSMAYNSLLMGSGFIYVDGKGDNTLYAKIFSMARAMGREDDVLVVNFMTGARDIVGPQEKRLSNTLNPFARGSSSMLSQLVISMMDSSSATPDGDMWKGRAISFVEALMKLLVYMRDIGAILLDANIIRNYFLLEKLEAIVVDKKFPRDKLEAVDLSSVPEEVLEPINNYIYNLPGYNKEKKGKQVSQVLEQHGFITMQLTRVFTSLADTYGHIIRTKLAEVDFHDVVLNRRILVVLLPALEKSPDELSNLGKIIVSSLKAMMASGLGEEVEGSYQDIIMRKPTNAPTPFMCILDEYGYYAVEGFAVVPAQARSLGFSAVFAGQDLPAFQKTSKEEAASIGANTNIKICMKLEDPTETWEFFSKTAGESYVTKVDAFSTRPTSMLNNYLDTRSASSEKRARVDLLDLKDQGVGEAHVFFQSKIIRARTFYADPKPVKYMRINHFLKVDKPDMRELVALHKRLTAFKASMQKSEFFETAVAESEDIKVLSQALQANQQHQPIERGVQALKACQNRSDEVIAEEDVLPEIPLTDEELNLFTDMRVTPERQASLLVSDLSSFGLPLLDKKPVLEQINLVERALGRSQKQALNIAHEIVNDMTIATQYPPIIYEQKSLQEVIEIANAVNWSIQQAVKAAAENEAKQ